MAAVAQPGLWDRIRGKPGKVRQRRPLLPIPTPASPQPRTGPSCRPLHWSEHADKRDDLSALGPVVLRGKETGQRYKALAWRHFGPQAGVLLARWEERESAPTVRYECFVDAVLVVEEPGQALAG